MLLCNINVYITKVALLLSYIANIFCFRVCCYGFGSLVINHDGRYRTPESSTVAAAERAFLPTRF